jgi:hypothetical protein
MPRRALSLLVLVSLAILAGSATAVLASSSSAEGFICPNTYCNPGWAHCEENAGSQCYLDGGCQGWEMC